MSKLTPDEIIEQCIEAIQTGEKTVSDCLRQYPEQKASLEVLLPLTQALSQSPNALPRPPFRSQARKQLLSQLPPAGSPSFWSNLFSHFSLASAMAVLVAGFILSIGFLYLADASAPGDRLYYIDRSIETMRLNWAKNNPDVATNLYNQFAEERLREAQALAETGDAENAQVALDNYHTTVLALTTQEEQTTPDNTPSSTIADRPPLSDMGLGSTLIMADCTYSQGYWKNHIENWPIAKLTIGGVTYTEAELLVIMHTPPRGDATYSLMHQLIAAHLNGENGASGGSTWLAEADAWLIANPLGSNPTGEAKQEATILTSSLDDYNNGLLGSIHCDELTITPTPIVTSTVTPTASYTPVPTITPSPTVTTQPSATPTPTIAATPVVTGTSPAPEPTACTDTNPHPRGTALANQFGVSYDEIMGWFCSGFGFGEIEQAYSLSQETAVSVTDIFAMKQSGMGWGQIRQELSNNTDNNTGNGNNSNNNNSNGNNGNDSNSNGNNGNNNNSNGNNGNDSNSNGNNGNDSNSNGNNGNNSNSNGNNGNDSNSNGNNGNGNNGNGNKKDK